MTQVSRLSHGSFSQYYFYGILQWIINNLSMCGNFPLHYLDNCTYKLLVVLGATVVSLFLCIIIAMKCCQLDKELKCMTETMAYPSLAGPALLQ